MRLRCTGVCVRAYAHIRVRARVKKRRAAKMPYAQKTNIASSDSRINFAILLFRPIRQTKSVRHSFPFDFSGEIFYKNQKFLNYFRKSAVFFLRFFCKYDRIYIIFLNYIHIKSGMTYSKNDGTALTARRRTDSPKN